MVGHPLAEDAAIASYVAPDPQRDSLYRDSERVVRTSATSTSSSA